MDFGGPGKLVRVNPVHLPKWAGLADTSLLALQISHMNFFLGINHYSAYKKVSLDQKCWIC